jgi:hypothetical protein
MKRKAKRTSSDTNRLGRSYAVALRERAQLLRTDLLLTKRARQLIADDLDALAQIAELHPQCFRGVK